MDYLGLPRTGTLVTLIPEHEGYIVVPLAITDLTQRFLVATEGGEFCGTARINLLQTRDRTKANAEIHRQISTIITAVKAGQVQPLPSQSGPFIPSSLHTDPNF